MHSICVMSRDQHTHLKLLSSADIAGSHLAAIQMLRFMHKVFMQHHLLSTCGLVDLIIHHHHFATCALVNRVIHHRCSSTGASCTLLKCCHEAAAYTLLLSSQVPAQCCLAVQGWIDVTYLSQDGRLRLTRGNKGFSATLSSHCKAHHARVCNS